MKRQALLPILAVPVDRANRNRQASYDPSSESIQASWGRCRDSNDCGPGETCWNGTCIGNYL